MKNIEPICRNCRLFDSENSRCMIIILHEGEKVHLPVEANEKCFFEDAFVAKESWKPAEDIKEVKLWVEDPKTGEKSDKGVVKIEYPEDFFGKPKETYTK